MRALAEGFHHPYIVSERDVKHPRLEFRTGTLLVVLPKGQNERRILKKHRKWIDRKYTFINDSVHAANDLCLVSRSNREFRQFVQGLVDAFSQELGLVPGKIFIRAMKTKWASCSKKGNITLNSLLQGLPNRILEYIIFHEMVHLNYRKHDESFWKYVRNKFPDTDEIEKELCAYWFAVQRNQDQVLEIIQS